jgi:hypothetical protein
MESINFPRAIAPGNENRARNLRRKTPQEKQRQADH